jgi:hypothetical protein
MTSIATSPKPYAPSWGKFSTQTLAMLFFIVTAIFNAFSSLGAVSRIRFGDGPFEFLVQRGFLPSLVLIACGFLYTAGVRKLNLFSFMLTCLFLYGAAWGAINSGITSFFISHAFQAVFAITLYLFGRHLQRSRPDLMRMGLDWVAKTTILINVPVILLFVFWYLTERIYFGFSAGTLILSLVVCMHAKQTRLAFLSAFLLLLTGKRGEMAGALAALITYFAVTGRLKYVHRAILPAVGVVVAGGVGLVVLQSVLHFDVLDQVFGKFAMLGLIDPTDLGSVETRNALGGRGMELVVFFDTFFNHGLPRLLTGLGYGWSASINYIDFVEAQTIHFVHVSPLNAIGQYGLILAGVYWGGIILTVIRSFRDIGSRINFTILVPFAVGMLTDTMTAYGLAVDPMIWVALGAISVPLKAQLAAPLPVRRAHA